MSYESTKTSANSSTGETMTTDMPSQPTTNNSFYPNSNTNNNNNSSNHRTQAMIMNPMMGTTNYYNGPTQGAPNQQAHMANRAIYHSYPSGPPHHHQILSPFDMYDLRTNAYYSSYSHDTGVYDHQPAVGRTYYGHYGENQVESSPYPVKDGSTTNNNNNTDMNATDSTTAPPHDQQLQSGNMPLPTAQTPSGNGSGYNNPSMMPPPHLASKQQPYPNYPQQQSGDMYSRTSNTSSTPQYVPQYSQYPPGGAPMMNPRSPAPNTNAYRPSYSSGSPYQNGVATSSSPSSTPSSGKSTSRSQQLSPKRSNTQPTTPPAQQSRYPSPYPAYSNGPVAYKPGGSNGYVQPPPPQQQSSWPPQTPQRDAVTPGLASSTGDSDSNSSNASQQPMSYPQPPPPMTNGPTTGSYPPQVSASYNASNVGDSNNTNNNMHSSGHGYIDQQYSNMPPQNYGYPPQQMNPYNSHPQQMHGAPTNEFRPPPVQSMDDENNGYRNKSSAGMTADQQQQAHSSSILPPSSASSQAQSVSSSTNGPKSPSGTSMSSYVPDEGDSSNSSFPDSPPPSHEKGQQKRKLSSGTSNSHNTPVEVFNKLREMGEESERQDRNLFVERLQKLWEENQIVCRNLPTISKQTIDLYRLYTCVREQNGFQEFSKVAKNRHWRDIAAKLNIPNSSSAAFNVKQKYINLKLFHYECKYDRGGINPEPILSEIDKPQGKRSKTPKKSSSNSGSTANNLNDSTTDNKVPSSQVPSQSQPPGLSSLPPQQQQQQQQQPMPQQPMQDPYRGYPPPPPHGHPHQMGHPQQQPQYRPMQMPMHPYGTTGNEMQSPYDPSAGGPMMYNNSEMDYQRTGYPTPPGQPHPPPSQMMKPPPPNAYGMPLPQVQQPPGPMPPQHRLPGPYPSIASKPQQQQQMGAPAQGDYSAPPNQQAPPQSAGPQQTYHYQPQQPMPSPYPPSGYPQQQAPPRTQMMGGPPQSHDPYLSQQVPPNQTYPNQTPPNYMYKKPETPSTTDASNLDGQDSNKGNKLLINQLRASSSNTSMLSTATPISILTNSTSTTSNSTLTPTTALPTTSFPPNSVEATTLPVKMKRKKLTGKDVMPVDPWKLMMSLRGGLLAETTWALDTINIMLSDDQTHTHFRLKQMPGLLQAIVDIYVKCLTQLFDEFQNSPSNIENQQPSLNDLNGSSHLTCTTIKKHEYRQQQESIIYRVESNSLNRYKRKYHKEQSVVYDRVFD
ncbi:unnamed protein product, partial [Adineta ricciae]